MRAALWLVLAASPLLAATPWSVDALSPAGRVAVEAKSGVLARKVAAAFRQGDARTSGRSASVLAPLPPETTADGRLPVAVAVTTVDGAVRAALAQAGLDVHRADERAGLVEGAIAPADLARLAALPAVRTVRPIDRPRHRTGSALSEGDGGLRADLARTLGVDGSGIAVGVVSDGIDSIATAAATGDVGPTVVPPDPRCSAGSGDEGTALLEIVHDLAPGASLLFSGPSSALDMVDTVECLADAGARVIVDDVGFPGQPWFSDGPVAQGIRAVAARGVVYVTAAGNDAQNTIEQDFRATPGSGYHDFLGGPVDNTAGVLVPPFGALTCVLQWDEPFGAAANDYDLYVYDASLNLVTVSDDVQDGTQDPIEAVQVGNFSAFSALANLAIRRYAGAPRRLRLLCFGSAGREYSTPDGSVYGHAAVAEVVTVGAVDAADPGLDTVEPYSSRGPGRIRVPAPAERPKPDVVALDGVTISNAGGFPDCPPACRFFGTSAAAPHAAAVAALILDRNPYLSRATVAQVLRASAVDVAAVGFDSSTGAGRIDAFAAVSSVAPPECAVDRDCDDGSVCTTDQCHEGACVRTPVACDDGDACNGTATCDPVAGCRPGTPPDCTRVDACDVGSCDPAQGCVVQPPTGVDGTRCLLQRLADPGVCAASDVDAKVDTQLQRRIRTLLKLLDRVAAARTHRAGKVRRRKLGSRLGALSRSVEHWSRRGAVRGACVDTLRTGIARTRTAAGTVG
jgi:subtilisin family serine protease